jgi:hypothetical protein
MERHARRIERRGLSAFVYNNRVLGMNQRVANPVGLPEDLTTEYARVRASTEYARVRASTEKKLHKISVNSAYSAVKGFPGPCF